MQNLVIVSHTVISLKIHKKIAVVAEPVVCNVVLGVRCNVLSRVLDKTRLP